jgi:hypothetical protein
MDQGTGESRKRALATRRPKPYRMRGDRVMYRRLRRDTGLSRSLPGTILASFLVTHLQRALTVSPSR